MKKEIALDLHKIGAIKFGEFKLKSGIMSPIYIDMRVIVSHPTILRKIGNAMIEITKNLKFDRIAGIPYTGLPIATAMSLEMNWPMIYMRKETKDYGTKKKIEGQFEKGMTALIVDDLITTGASKFETIQPFEDEGLKVKDIVVLVDREQGGARVLKEKGYALHSVLGANELLDHLHAAKKMDDDDYKTAKNFINQVQV
jgi:uridine monophosphate synthetase